MAPDAKLAVRFPLSLARVECRQYSELVSTCHPLTGQVSSTHSAGVRQSPGIGCFSQSFVRPALAVKFRVRCFTGPSGQHSALEMAVGLTRTRRGHRCGSSYGESNYLRSPTAPRRVHDSGGDHRIEANDWM
ncbi:hypothetical protein LSH36_852g01034 [Paralvinella palmiformis]|uniref:Uncharacterized protein n=1 Tax=Paralvinella palmiformis TaxID=53620 RepID=A0AAD9MUD5_9ANNE|nr:hypothetical protein LSH36_852g01034 [Paralvinella palmiformis]